MKVIFLLGFLVTFITVNFCNSLTIYDENLLGNPLLGNPSMVYPGEPGLRYPNVGYLPNEPDTLVPDSAFLAREPDLQFNHAFALSQPQLKYPDTGFLPREPELQFNPAFEPSLPKLKLPNAEYQSSSLRPFASFVYQLISPTIFNKAFDPNLTPQEAADACFNSALLFSQHMGLPCYEEGTLPLQMSQAIEGAFQRGITPLKFFSAFVDDMEDYLIEKGIMTPCNVQLLGYKYYELLRDEFEEIDITQTPVARFYHTSVANAKFLESFGVLPHKNELYTMYKIIDNLNRV